MYDNVHHGGTENNGRTNPVKVPPWYSLCLGNPWPSSNRSTTTSLQAWGTSYRQVPLRGASVGSAVQLHPRVGRGGFREPVALAALL